MVHKNHSSLLPEIQGTTLIVIPQEQWHALYDKLNTLASLIEKRNTDDLNSEWIESEVARKLLGVSAKTWQTYRDRCVIHFSQISRKIYVNRADLDAFLRSQCIPSKFQVIHCQITWDFHL